VGFVTNRLHLTTNEAAELAGVGASTVKRWADEGVLRCVRTAGGHRRFERFDFERFLREHASPGSGQRDPQRVRWFEALCSGRRYEVDALLMTARARLGSWHQVAEEVGAVLTELGNEWAGGRITLAGEHLISESLARALARISAGLPTREYEKAPSCVLACPDEEEHTLGLSLAELCLAEVGWTALWLGRRTPISETARLAVDSGAKMVALSASAAASDRALLRHAVEEIGPVCNERDISLVLGGSGAWPETLTHGVRLGSFGAFHDYIARLEERA
jgi:MerR family transcriptional regulator, light-induced transcriptional regulator